MEQNSRSLAVPTSLPRALLWAAVALLIAACAPAPAPSATATNPPQTLPAAWTPTAQASPTVTTRPASPVPLPTMAADPTPQPTSGPLVWRHCEGAPYSQLQVGNRAYVVYAPAITNRLRDQPDPASRILALLSPGTELELLDGPACASGMVWWKVRVLITGRVGWTAEGDASGHWLVPYARRVSLGLPLPPPTLPRLAFASSRLGEVELYSMELWRTASGIEPTRLRRLTDGLSQVAFPAWSPDGTRLAFLTDRDDADYGIYVLRVNGSMLARVLDAAAMYSSLAWDPSGERIAYVCDRQICLLDLGTGGSAALGESLPAGLYASSPAWSPDGTRLAFVSNRAGVPAIFTMDGEGKDIQKLADDPALPQSLAWSPTGEWIAVGSDAPGSGIFLLRPDGSEVRLLVENAYYPTWSPDGRWLAYTARPLESLQPVILLIDVLEALQGRPEPVRLTEDNVYNDFPAWAPNSPGLAER